jgi:hypothetical protein
VLGVFTGGRPRSAGAFCNQSAGNTRLNQQLMCQLAIRFKKTLMKIFCSHRAGKAIFCLFFVGALACLTGCANFFPDDTTTTTLTSSATSATYETAITFTATISTTLATGTVTFYDGTTSLGTGTLSSGIATLSNSTLAVGTHSITAVYAGDSTYSGSTSSAVSIVIDSDLTATTTVLASSATSISYGTSITLTATVSSSSATGTVDFYDGTTVVGSAVLSSGTASYVTTTLPIGTDVIKAIYVGDSSYATSTSATVTVSVVEASS